MTYPTDDLGNPRVDFVFGNMPLQPNDQRGNWWNQLGVLDNHAIAATEWNTYPFLRDNRAPGSKNYMITALEYMGDVVYECTSQNSLKAGDQVIITGVPYLNGPWQQFAATVSYADATKFQFLAEIGSFAKQTGLTGRVDVVENGLSGQTLEGGGVFYWPAMGICNNSPFTGENRLSDAIEYFVGLGVPRSYFKDFTFSGGDNAWDAHNGEPNWDGAIWYIYVPAEATFGYDFLGRTVYGSDMAGQIAWGNWPSGYELSVDTGQPEDYSIGVFTNDPRKDNAWWWFN